jgi:prevent-host-death family protein
MRVSITEARDRFTDIVRRAEAGEEIILTRRGHAVLRLAPFKAPVDDPGRRAPLDEVCASADGRRSGGR